MRERVGNVLAASEAIVRTDTPVARLACESGDWFVVSDDRHGPFDAIVCTPPAPVTADLLADGDWDDPARGALVDAARDVSYATIRSVAAGYDRPLDRPYYALVNTDDAHRVGWFSRESCKPGHAPDGETLIVQGGHDWSAQYAERDRERVTERLVGAASEVIGESWLAEPAWTDATLWRHALPEESVVPGPLRDAETHGLFCAGDWVARKARLHAAGGPDSKPGSRSRIGCDPLLGFARLDSSLWRGRVVCRLCEESESPDRLGSLFRCE